MKSIKITYTDNKFRSVIARYIESFDDSNDYRKDIGFLEVMNLFEKEKNITIKLCFAIKDKLLSNGNQCLEFINTEGKSYINEFKDSKFCSQYLNILMNLENLFL